MIIVVKHKKPAEIYMGLSLKNELEGPRDVKQIRNIKYNLRKASTMNSVGIGNIADEYLNVHALLTTHDFVQTMIYHKQSNLIIILYTNDQITDLTAALKSGAILAVDKTYNLSSVYVTATCYKNKKLICNKFKFHQMRASRSFLLF